MKESSKNSGVWKMFCVRSKVLCYQIIICLLMSTGSATAITSNTIIGLTTGLYIGGLPPKFEIRRGDVGNMEVIRNNYMGCMRDIRIEKVHLPIPYWEDLDWESSLVERNVVPSWQGCPTSLQEGGHFLGGGKSDLIENIMWPVNGLT